MAQNEEKNTEVPKDSGPHYYGNDLGSRSPCDCAGCRNCIELYKYLQIKKELCRRHKLLFLLFIFKKTC